MIKTVVFDLGNVILPFDFSICCEKLSRISPYSAEEIYLSGVKSEIVLAYERGKISSLDFYKQITSALSANISFDDFRDAWNEIFTENKHVSALIKRLKNKYRLLLLSNTNEMHFDYACRQYPVLNEFDDFILSFQLRLMKPETQIYEEVIRRADAAPEEIVYIDDIEIYAEAAKKSGIRGITFCSNEQLARDLAGFGIS